MNSKNIEISLHGSYFLVIQFSKTAQRKNVCPTVFGKLFFWATFFSGSRYLAPHSKHYGPGKQGLQTCIWSYPAKAQRAGAETENCQLGWANPGEIISCVP